MEWPVEKWQNGVRHAELGDWRWLSIRPAAFMRWAFVIDRLRHDRRGKTDMRSD
jgi:hypothetical protein